MHRVPVYMPMSRMSLCAMVSPADPHDLGRALTLFSCLSTVDQLTLNLPVFFL
jgi:hypothetical protein